MAIAAAVVLLCPVAQAQDAGQVVDVAIDPGHSRADVGAAGGGFREYVLTMDVAQRLQADLTAMGLTWRMTRQDDQPLTALTNPNSDDQIRIEQTARIEAGAPARVFVSLHFNGGPASLRGTETYYNPERADGADKSDRQLAEALQQGVVSQLANAGYPSTDRGVKSDLWAGKPYGHFFSLRGPMPSALVESLFLSNAADVAALRDDATLDAIAAGVAQGIREYLAGLD